MANENPTGKRIGLSKMAEEAGMSIEQFADQVMDCFGAQILSQIRKSGNNPLGLELDYDEGTLLILAKFVPADDEPPPGEVH